MKEYIMKWIVKISYQERYKKKMEYLKNEYKKCIEMNENEFLLKYIEIKSLYEYRKMICIPVMIICLLLILFVLRFVLSRYVVILNMQNIYTNLEMQAIKTITIVLTLLVVFGILLVFICFSNKLYRTIKEKVFIDEVKQKRETNNEKV
ncbi:MAG: hypothetical protein EOM50_07105 [Erysipelotrichia bacterium]|nr:hypothetical protein [Erysipelotrichia bacterium]